MQGSVCVRPTLAELHSRFNYGLFLLDCGVYVSAPKIHAGLSFPSTVSLILPAFYLMLWKVLVLGNKPWTSHQLETPDIHNLGQF